MIDDTESELDEESSAEKPDDVDGETAEAEAEAEAGAAAVAKAFVLDIEKKDEPSAASQDSPKNNWSGRRG